MNKYLIIPHYVQIKRYYYIYIYVQNKRYYYIYVQNERYYYTYMLRMKDNIIYIYVQNERWSAGIVYGERALSSLEFYYGEKAGLLASLNMRYSQERDFYPGGKGSFVVVNGFNKYYVKFKVESHN